MTAILGISAFYHDSAAALVVDGRIVAAAQEERFSRKKHDASFPAEAVAFCLKQAGLTPSQLDYVGFYEKPLRKLERLIDTWLSVAPGGFSQFLQAAPVWFREKMYPSRLLHRGLGGGYRKHYTYLEHHESHAASAFFPSPFEEAAILTLDGVGETATGTLGVGRGHRIELSHEQRFPHSLGLLYSAFTYHAGFRVNSGEYKLMGLAPYGTPRYADLILERLVDVKPDGSLRIDLSYFDYCRGLTMTSERFHRLLGGPPRKPESPLTQREMDLAASIQAVTDEIVLRSARHLHALTGLDRLCMAGGVALNCVANGKLLKEGPFREIWIQPAAGDAGGALGTALFIWHQLLGNEREPSAQDSMNGAQLGPGFEDRVIRDALDAKGMHYRVFEDDEGLCAHVAELIASQKVVGWFQGRMEFGPRALGSRSILADPRSEEHRATLNLKVKFRESFRPFAPSVLAEKASDWFEMTPEQPSPYMLFTFPCKPADHGASRPLPAITHVDGSARVQTVDGRNELYHRLLRAFDARTGCPVLINTSFNVRGEPIVCTPDDALRCFLNTNLDALAIGHQVVLRDEQDNAPRHELPPPEARFPMD